MLTGSGFDAALGDAQPETVDGGIRLMLAVVPLGFTALAWLCFWLCPIRSRDVASNDVASPDVVSRDA